MMSQEELTILKNASIFLDKHGQNLSASTVRVAIKQLKFVAEKEKADPLKPAVRLAIDQLTSMQAAAALQRWPQDVKFLGNAINVLTALAAEPVEATTPEITKLVERQEQLEAAIASLRVDVEALKPRARDINVWGPH